ncbi:MAG: cytochrome P450 [Acidimicrobiales bacterium]|nr:cytochrome P450 [Acidimicrobiales bacterium]
MPSPKLLSQLDLLRRILKDPQPVLDELARSVGPVCGLGIGPMRLAIVGDPAVLRELFAKPNDSFRWNHRFNLLAVVVGPGSMIVSDGAEHKRRRSSVQSAFSRRRLNGWIPMIVEQTDSAIDDVLSSVDPAGEVVDMYRVGRLLVVEIVVRAMFGERLAGHAAEFGELFQRAQDYLEAPAYRQIPHRLPFTARARVGQDRRAFDAIVDEEIAHLRAEPTDDPLNVLASLVAQGDLTDGEIRDQVNSLIGAGYDTTSASLAWMLWRATLEPGLWARLGDEADAVFGRDQDGGSDSITLAHLDLANRVMRETLRLHPAGVVSPREAAVDVVVGGYSIPKGTVILWSAYLAGRNETAWTEPLSFNPDRFLDLTAEQREIANSSWVPFGGGARNCIGFALAQMELTLIIARMAQRLNLVPNTSKVPRPVGMVVNRPSGGAPMLATRRAKR